jgi:hypothetical protein
MLRFAMPLALLLLLVSVAGPISNLAAYDPTPIAHIAELYEPALAPRP